MSQSPLMKTVSIAASMLVVFGLAIPAFADPPTADVGAQNGSGATKLKIQTDTSEYGGTEISSGNYANPDSNGDGLGDNIAFTAPSAINFVLKASGDLIGPSASKVFIENESAYGIHVSGVKVDETESWNIVTDVDDNAVSTSNTASMTVGPAMYSTEKVNLQTALASKYSIAAGSVAKWGMSAKDAAENKDRLNLTLEGKAKNVTATL